MAAKLSFAQCFSDALSGNAENFCHFIYSQEWLGKANTLQEIISKEHAIQSGFVEVWMKPMGEQSLSKQILSV
jgi:hypothetical protein